MIAKMFESVRELLDHSPMIHNMVKREIRGRYKGSALGFLWNFITPIMQIIVYILVFSIVFRVDIDNYYMYIITGMVPWIFFSDSLIYGSGSIVDNYQLVTSQATLQDYKLQLKQLLELDGDFEMDLYIPELDDSSVLIPLPAKMRAAVSANSRDFLRLS